jgi:hypothetical protein
MQNPLMLQLQHRPHSKTPKKDGHLPSMRRKTKLVYSCFLLFLDFQSSYSLIKFFNMLIRFVRSSFSTLLIWNPIIFLRTFQRKVKYEIWANLIKECVLVCQIRGECPSGEAGVVLCWVLFSFLCFFMVCGGSCKGLFERTLRRR